MADNGLTSLALPTRILGQMGLRLLADGYRDPLTAIPSELTSGADRLRPPYATPMQGPVPATSGASRDVEVGFNRLPAEYQRGLRQLQPIPLTAGVMPPGYNVAGETNFTDRYIVGDEPKTMAHELVHVLAKQMGKPWPRASEEALARYITDTNLDRTPTPDAIAAAKEADAQIRARFPEPSPPPDQSGGLMSLIWKAFGR